MGLLDTYQDPGLEIDLKLSQEKIAGIEVARLQAALAVVSVTGQIPRRLSDGTREELALDKRRARRVAHVLHQCLVAWGGAVRPPTDEERVAGAQLEWAAWAEQQGTELSARVRYVATWAKKTSNLRFGKTAVVRLVQEADWMEYALRD